LVWGEKRGRWVDRRRLVWGKEMGLGPLGMEMGLERRWVWRGSWVGERCVGAGDDLEGRWVREGVALWEGDALGDEDGRGGFWEGDSFGEGDGILAGKWIREGRWVWGMEIGEGRSL